MIRELALRLPGENKGLDAQTLLVHISGRNRAWLLSHPEAELTANQIAELEDAVQKLCMGMPLPYVVGHWEFFGMDFIVSPDVLIPRPETELLVESALSHARHYPKPETQILDIGTGSGIIPISLAVHLPEAWLTAIDISSAALKVAQLNADRHGVRHRIHFLEADLFPPELQLARFDIICANLPYIPTSTLHSLDIFGKEPELALDGGPDGMDLIRNLLDRLAISVAANTLILLEIEYRQGQAAYQYASSTFPDADIQIKRDLSGQDRLVVIHT